MEENAMDIEYWKVLKASYRIAMMNVVAIKDDELGYALTAEQLRTGSPVGPSPRWLEGRVIPMGEHVPRHTRGHRRPVRRPSLWQRLRRFLGRLLIAPAT